MTRSITLPGSRTDAHPLVQCTRCPKQDEPKGGIWNAGRFMCRSCWVARMNRQRAA